MSDISFSEAVVEYRRFGSNQRQETWKGPNNLCNDLSVIVEEYKDRQSIFKLCFENME